MQKEFSYPLKIETLNRQEQHYLLKANKEQCMFLKDVLQVEDVLEFNSDIYLKLDPKQHRLDIKGIVSAKLVLKSVISLENFEKSYEAPFAYFFDTQATYQDIKDMEPSINDEVPDIIENGEIDLGNISIEQLALVIEDYPRQQGEEFSFKPDFDPQTLHAENPFSALKKLKK